MNFTRIRPLRKNWIPIRPARKKKVPDLTVKMSPWIRIQWSLKDFSIEQFEKRNIPISIWSLKYQSWSRSGSCLSQTGSDPNGVKTTAKTHFFVLIRKFKLQAYIGNFKQFMIKSVSICTFSSCVRNNVDIFVTIMFFFHLFVFFLALIPYCQKLRPEKVALKKKKKKNRINKLFYNA